MRYLGNGPAVPPLRPERDRAAPSTAASERFSASTAESGTA